MKFLVLCILLGAPLALAEKRQYTVNADQPQVWYGPEGAHTWVPPTCHTVCERQAPNDNDDEDTIRIQTSRYRRNINANIIEIREAPAKAIAIGLPPPLLNFGEERILRDESNEERPIAEQNSTNYDRSATIGEP